MARRSAENAIDWDAIERAFRPGKKTIKQLAFEFGVQASSISRRIKQYGWVADKSENVDAVTNSLLIQNASGNANPNATPSELEIKAAGQANADVVLRHRKDLARLAKLRDNLIGEIEVITDNLELFRQLGELMDKSSEDEDGKRRQDKMNAIYVRVIDMSERIDNAKKLAEIDERVRKGEREAFGIDKGENDKGNAVDALLKRINEAGE